MVPAAGRSLDKYPPGVYNTDMQNDLKRRALRRLKIVAGQVKGLERAIASEKYCIDILTQSLAVQKSLQSLDAVVLENHLKTHARHQLQHKKDAARAVGELVKIFKLSGK